MMTALLSAALLLGLVATSGASTFDSVCGGRIISPGDTSADVIMKCVAPDWKESHREEIIEKVDKDTTRKIINTIEEWTYNFGPNVFMRIIKFKDGRVVEAGLGGYGYPKDGTNEFTCEEKIVSIGDSKADVFMKCGRPSWTNKYEEKFREILDDTRERIVSADIEEWTYNFGPNKFLRIFKFRNGRVVDIKTGGYGDEDAR